tara:strand:+ start:1751 stop:2743 length:993 start_codon:yes stop_codon:yes gene_type:complete
MTTPTTKDNYVGMEIECFGPLDDDDLERELNKVPALVDKFEVADDPSIHPEENNEPKKGDIKYEREQGKVETVKFDPNDYDQRDAFEGDDIHLIEVKGKQGLFFIDERQKMAVEYKYSGKIWIITGNQYDLSDGDFSMSNWDLDDAFDEYVEEQLGEPNTYEIKLIFKQSEMMSIIPKVFKVLRDCKVKVNSSCGLHVHLDARNRNRKDMYNNLFKCQDAIIDVSSNKRIEGRWCTKNIRSTYDGQMSEYERYKVINVRSYERHSTIEVRVGRATLEVGKVLAYVRMLTNIVDSEKINTDIKTTAAYCKKFKTSVANKKALIAMKKDKAA